MSIDNNFMESYGDFKKTHIVAEAESEAEINQKIKEMMEKSKEAKKNSLAAKKEHEDFARGEATDEEIEIALLQYKKFKAQAEMIAAQAKLLKKGRDIDDEKSK